eukprot:TRINITY_DN4768_c0_g1_i1.p2 TRINITY_DN4768_c0_g1~~TRINITY_DN4768_c0_g1_i1.p2  ORF type:complete len:320 (+),score=24.79 TRINITY_DN4768_c0_g1_i1:1-960(+)
MRVDILLILNRRPVTVSPVFKGLLVTYYYYIRSEFKIEFQKLRVINFLKMLRTFQGVQSRSSVSRLEIRTSFQVYLPLQNNFVPKRFGYVRVQPQIVCKVQSRRVAKVSRQIEREIGDLLLNDRALQNAVCPERLLGDSTLSAIASVTEVELSGDLQVAKVYISVFSDAAGKMRAWQGLQKLQGYVRKTVAARLNIRLSPEIRFVLDDSIERSERVMKLLDRVKLQQDGKVEAPPIAIPSEELDVDEDEIDQGQFLEIEDDLGDDDDEDQDGFFDDLDKEPIGTSGISYTSQNEFSQQRLRQYGKPSKQKQFGKRKRRK